MMDGVDVIAFRVVGSATACRTTTNCYTITGTLSIGIKQHNACDSDRLESHPSASLNMA